LSIGDVIFSHKLIKSDTLSKVCSISCVSSSLSSTGTIFAVCFSSANFFISCNLLSVIAFIVVQGIVNFD
jgi:hypothetical protein